MCDATQQPIISTYSPDKPYKVYDQKIRRSDVWNARDYARDIDYNKTFTEQFWSLMKAVPHCSILNIQSENSEFTNICAYNKNCYLLIESSNNEDCLYWYRLQKSQNCIDCSMLEECSVCYESVDLQRCHALFYSKFCQDSAFSYLIENCLHCSHCFGCVGLSNKKYCVYNQQKTQAEYESHVARFLHGSDSERKKMYEDRNVVKKEYGTYDKIRNSSESDWEYLYNSKHVFASSHITDAQQVRYSKHVWFNSGDCMDVDTVGYNSYRMYECINTALDAQSNIWCARCWNWCSHNLYCFNCDALSHCFWCVWLRQQSYCIFNKAYSVAEYEQEATKLIQHMQETWEWWEFFSPELSPYWYNETIAHELFPVEYSWGTLKCLLDWDETKHELYLDDFWFTWSSYEPPRPLSQKVVSGSELWSLDDIWVRTVVACTDSGGLYRFQPKELAFYKKYWFPLPHFHPDVRHTNRLKRR